MELINLLTVCRLCLKSHSNHITIFGDESLVKKIASVLRYPIKQSESLSSLICPPCYGTIFNFAEYAENVGKNQAYLELMLQDGTISRTAKAAPIALERSATIPAARPSDLEDESDQEDAAREQLPVVTHGQKKPRNDDDHLIRQYAGLHCEVCERQLDSFQQLKVHCRIEHGTVARVSCCGKRFTRRDRLHTHILNHVQPDAFKCETCGQICKSTATLQAHRKQHLSQGSWAFQCSKCEKRFVSRPQLTNHEVSHVPSDQRKHVCPTCTKTFAFKYALVRHMKIHNRNSKEFVCEICAKPYSTEAGLKQHLINHSSEGKAETRVQCKICNQSYKNWDTLRLHIRNKHKSGGVHHCDSCEKDFPTKSTLAAHNRYVHIRDVRFTCDVCGAAFRRRIELKEHAARHTGKALYECDVCGQSFNHSSNYSMHRKHKHQTLEKAVNNGREKLAAESEIVV